MLRNFLILSSFFVAINAGGEFSVLSSPKSINFKGSEPLDSQYVSDVLNAALGNSVEADANWSGLTINDPFNLGKGVIAVVVDGTNHITINSKAKTYELQGSGTDESVSALSSELESSNVPVCDIDFNQFDEAVDVFRNCFGDIPVVAAKDTKNLNDDKHFLQSVAYINSVADNLANMIKPSNFLVIRVTLESVAKAHGEKSEAMTEALKLVSSAVANLNTAAQKSSNNDALVVVFANKSDGKRVKRQALPATPTENKYNLATYYNQDYPVIFNIILWFMVIFGLSLLAICYAIGSMDPGRDSIIYRMTSTRMKKDN